MMTLAIVILVSLVIPTVVEVINALAAVNTVAISSINEQFNSQFNNSSLSRRDSKRLYKAANGVNMEGQWGRLELVKKQWGRVDQKHAWDRARVAVRLVRAARLERKALAAKVFAEKLAAAKNILHTRLAVAYVKSSNKKEKSIAQYARRTMLVARVNEVFDINTDRARVMSELKANILARNEHSIVVSERSRIESVKAAKLEVAKKAVEDNKMRISMSAAQQWALLIPAMEMINRRKAVSKKRRALVNALGQSGHNVFIYVTRTTSGEWFATTSRFTAVQS